MFLRKRLDLVSLLKVKCEELYSYDSTCVNEVYVIFKYAKEDSLFSARTGKNYLIIETITV